MELCSVLHSNLDGRGIWGRMDKCISVCVYIYIYIYGRVPLLFNWLYPNTKLKAKKKKKENTCKKTKIILKLAK